MKLSGCDYKILLKFSFPALKNLLKSTQLFILLFSFIHIIIYAKSLRNSSKNSFYYTCVSVTESQNLILHCVHSLWQTGWNWPTMRIFFIKFFSYALCPKSVNHTVNHTVNHRAAAHFFLFSKLAFDSACEDWEGNMKRLKTICTTFTLMN